MKMAYTRFDQGNADFSSRMHELAREMIYPKLFSRGKDLIRYDENTTMGSSERGNVLDGEMGIDRIVRLSVEGLKAPIPFTIQERFRTWEYEPRQDVTITEWNHDSNLPSELYKMQANIFLYGYANQSQTGFLDALAISTVGMMTSLAERKMPYSRWTNQKNQTFIAITFERLEKAGLVLWRMKEAKQEEKRKGGVLANPKKTADYILNNYPDDYSGDWIGELIAHIGPAKQKALL